MASLEGPPARNTRAVRHSQTCKAQSVPSREEQGGIRVPSEIVAPREESVLSSITESRSDVHSQPEGVIPGGNAPSEQGTIRERSEEPHEQSFTTAAGSIGLSSAPLGISAAPSEVPQDRGKGHMPADTAERKTRPLSSEDWDDLLEAAEKWTDLAKQCQEDSIRLRQEVTNNYHRSGDVRNAMQSMQDKIKRLRSRAQEHASPEHSPRALASQALYADRGSSEGTTEYQRCKDAQACFETPQPSVRVEEVESYGSSPYVGTEEQSAQCYAKQMAASRARAAWKRPRG